MFKVLELSGLFVFLGGLAKIFSAWGGTEEIARLWFARGGVSIQADTMSSRLKTQCPWAYNRQQINF